MQTAFPQSPVRVAVAPLIKGANVSVTPCVFTMEAAVETFTQSAQKKVSRAVENDHLTEKNICNLMSRVLPDVY